MIAPRCTPWWQAARILRATAFCALCFGTAQAEDSPDGLLLRLFPPLDINVESVDTLVEEVDQAGGRTWVAANIGLYWVDGYQTKRQPCGENGSALAVEDVDGRAWVGTSGGLFRVEGSRCVALLKADFGGVRRLKAIHDEKTGALLHLLLGSSRGGLYRLDVARLRQSPPFSPEPIVGVVGEVAVIEPIAGEVWIGTSRGVFRLEADGTGRPLLGESFEQCLAISSWGDRACFLLTAGDKNPRLTCSNPDGSLDEDPLHSYQNQAVWALGSLRDGPHFSTQTNVRRLEVLTAGAATEREPVFSLDQRPDFGTINRLLTALGRDVVLTDRGFYWRNTGDWWGVPVDPPGTLGLQLAKEISGQLWMWGAGGAFLFEEGGRLEVAFNGTLKDDVWSLDTDPLKLEPVAYVDSRGAPLPFHLPLTHFQAKLVSSRNSPSAQLQMTEALRSKDWSPATDLRIPLAELSGEVLSYRVRDRLGNVVSASASFKPQAKEPPKETGSWGWVLKMLLPVGLVLLFAALIFLSSTLTWPKWWLTLALRWPARRPLVASLLDVRWLLGRLLGSYRKHLATLATTGASGNLQAEEDLLQSGVLKALSQTAQAQILCADKDTAQRSLAASMLSPTWPRDFRGALPIFVYSGNVAQVGKPEELFASIRQIAVQELVTAGKLGDFALAEIAFESGPFLVVVLGTDGTPAARRPEQLHEAWKQNKTQSGLCIQTSRPGGGKVGKKFLEWIEPRPESARGAVVGGDPETFV